MRGNVNIGGSAGKYPPGNTFPGSLDEAGVAHLRSGELRARAPQSAGAAGADMAQLLRAIEGVAPLEPQRKEAARASLAAP